MKLVCKQEFGNFQPGDEVEVPDESVFDGSYFEVAEEAPPKPAADAVPVVPASTSKAPPKENE